MSCFRELPLNKRELARITGAGSGCHHARRRAGNTQKGGRKRVLGVHTPRTPCEYFRRVLWRIPSGLRGPAPAFQSGLLGVFRR